MGAASSREKAKDSDSLCMQARPATYALLMACASDQQVEIGKLGRLDVRPGFYVYVGSAFGPGGLKARISHHARITARPHWHIDYLRSILPLNEVWYSYDTARHEHQWAQTFSGLKGATLPIAGFGASDCRCQSHLLWFSSRPAVSRFRDRLGTRLNGHRRIFTRTLIRNAPDDTCRSASAISPVNPNR